MSRKKQRENIGKGMQALLANIDKQTGSKRAEAVQQLANTVAELPLSQIKPNRFQPREVFEEDAMEELAQSIRAYGLIQPITVRRISAKSYELISGERRLRASKMAALKVIPAYIRLADDQEMMEMALVENIQRADLNPIEVAMTYARLAEEFDMTHEQIASRVGKGRITVTNFLGLLNLPDMIQEAIRREEISAGHGRALARLKDFGQQREAYQRILQLELSVSQTDALIKRIRDGKPDIEPAKKSALPDDYREAQDQLRRHLGIKKLSIQLKKRGQGSILIPFKSEDELNDLLDRMKE